jgi:hypothetical protein
MGSDRLREKTASVMKVNLLIAKWADTREFRGAGSIPGG